MLKKKDKRARKQTLIVCLEDLVPQDHLLRDIENAINFDFIYDFVKDLYSEDKGRPSIDPVVLIKINLIQYLYGIRSMRQTIKEIQVNMAYRWFLGYDLYEQIPHFTVFSKNYERRFKDTDLFERIFEKILEEAIKCGFISADAVFIDGTHIKASANSKKYEKQFVKQTSKYYQEQLMEEIQKDREKHGKKPLKDKDDDDEGSPKTKSIKVSKTDPDSGMFHKGEKERCFAYTAHVACDKHNFVLHAEVAAGNVHDSTMFSEVYKNVKRKCQGIKALAVDAGYKIPAICKEILDDGKLPFMPYKRPMTKKGFFKKYEYVYDEYYDCYICPNNEVLEYTTTNREGYKEYKSNPAVCVNCTLREKCTQSKNYTKVICRHVWEEYVEETEHLRHTQKHKEIYGLRSQTIERVFADAKEKHGMRYTTLRGLAKIQMQVKLIFACMNLKKLATWKRRRGMLSPNFYALLTFLFSLIFKTDKEKVLCPVI